MNQFHTGYLSGQISPEGEDFEVNVIAATREAVDPSVGVLLDAHGHYNVPISLHNAMGPLQILAAAHTMMTVPNLYRLEHDVANHGYCNNYVNRPLDFRGDQLHLSDGPGLDVDLDVELLEAKSVHRRPEP